MVRSLKRVIFFLFCLWEFIFSSHESQRCWTVHSDKRINYYSVGIRAKQSGTVKNLEHSKNDYHEHSKQVPKDLTGTVETLMRSGRKRSFTNRDRNALKRLVKGNRRLTLQDITAKQILSARKLCKGCCIRKDIKEGSQKRKWWFGKRIKKSEFSGVKSEEVGQ